MSEQSKTLALAAGFGIATGMRSMTPAASLSRHLLKRGPKREPGPLSRLLAEPSVAKLLSSLAAGEMAADKTPVVPKRTEPASLLGRAAMAGLCGSVIAEERGRSRIGPALVSSIAAAGSTVLAYKIRQNVEALTGLPNSVLGLIEDALVLGSVVGLTSALDSSFARAE